jgi:uncharacterized repeat protein (TIGR03803 family)
MAFSVLHSFVKDDGAWPSAGLIEGADGFLYGTTRAGGRDNQGTVFKVATDGSAFSVLHNFTGSDGANPSAELIQLPNGLLYGTASMGGFDWRGYGGFGTIFQISPDGSSFSVLHRFDGVTGAHPSSPLVLKDRVFYGTVASGHLSRDGAVFRLETDGSGFSLKVDFHGANGRNPTGLMSGPDGFLYGATTSGGARGGGTIFKFGPNQPSQTIHEFDSARSPTGSLVFGFDGALYGSTRSGAADRGTLFRLSSDGSSVTTLHVFDEEGGPSIPSGVLHQAMDGTFYGTTVLGGRSDAGTIFRMSADGSSLNVLYSFDNDGLGSTSSLVQGSDGTLYGINSAGGASPSGTFGGAGAVFRLSPHGSGFVALHGLIEDEGANPNQAPLARGPDGAYYGTTSAGGALGGGTVFRVAPDGSSFAVLHDFEPSSTAGSQGGLLLGLDGAFYGATTRGGPDGSGTVFRILADGSSFLILHRFNAATDGSTPLSGLVQDADGALYGLTGSGPSSPFGAVFRLTPDGSAYTVLHQFEGLDGLTPRGRLVDASDGFLYGTTGGGGEFGRGTIFRVSRDGASFETLHSFKPSTAEPFGLTLGSDGNLYGTTDGGGAFGYGVIYRISIDGSGLDVLHSFDGKAGAGYKAPPIEGSDGALYGTTDVGGPGGFGVIYRLAHRSDDSLLQFLKPVFTSSEAGRTALLRVKRTGSRSGSLTVDYETSDRTATAGTDYVATAGQLSFAPGVAILPLRVTLVGDTTYEAAESFEVTLSNPVGPRARLGPQRTALVSIGDNDRPSILQLSALNYSVLEGEPSVNIIVVRSGPATDPVSVDFTTLDGTAVAPADYASSITTLNFDAGVMSRRVSVPIGSDQQVEPTESVRLRLSNPRGAVLGKRSNATLNIKDDDQAVDFIDWEFSAAEQSASARITVKRTGAVSGTLTVEYASSDATATANADYAPVTGQLVFAPGIVRQSFAVPILNDAVEEGSEFLLLSLRNANPPSEIGFDSALTILDDEPAVWFSALRYYVSEPVGTKTKEVLIGVRRRGRLDETVHVDYSTNSGSAVAGEDYVHVAGHLTFGPGVVLQHFAVPVLGNSIDRHNPIVNLTLLSVDIALGVPNDSVIVIRDNDKPR